jgi:hypothetical protein
MESFMEVGQGPNWGCSARGGGIFCKIVSKLPFTPKIQVYIAVSVIILTYIQDVQIGITAF